MIPRFGTKELIEILGYFPVLGITGPRQVGKTTLSKALAGQIEKEVIYLDMENPMDLSKLSEPALYFKKNEDACIIIDEVQRVPELFPILRSMIDQKRIPARFILTGSTSPELIRDSSESLAGRIAYKELTPFNYIEICTHKFSDLHWFRGGFPLSFLAPSDRISISWINNFIQTYIERDLPLLGLQAAPTFLRNIWLMLAHIHGNVMNMELLSKSLEVTGPTIKKYIHFLSEAYLIRILHPFHINIQKRIVKSPKIYIRDTGILHQLLGISTYDMLEGNPMKGNSWEGYVIEQIGLHVQNQYGLHFYRTHQGAECDLVLTIANKPEIAVEIKYTNAPKVGKGLRTSIEDLGTQKNFIICLSEEEYPIAENIIACSMDTFINKHLAKG
ncbi:ATP-binding protein [Bacteroidota bacterium]